MNNRSASWTQHCMAWHRIARHGTARHGWNQVPERRTVRELVLLGDGGLDFGAQLDLGAIHEVRAVVHQDEVRLHV